MKILLILPLVLMHVELVWSYVNGVSTLVVTVKKGFIADGMDYAY